MTNFDIFDKSEFIYSVYSVDESKIRAKSVKKNLREKACANDNTIEYVLFDKSVSLVKESAFENCRELQIAEWIGDGNLNEKKSSDVEELKKILEGTIGLNGKLKVGPDDKAENNLDVSGSISVKECTGQKNKGVENLPVISSDLNVQYHAFKDCSKLHTVVFPKTEKEKKIVIEKEAFSACSSLRTVVLCGDGDFEIDDYVFSGCNTDRLVFVVSKESGAERFAREHGYRWVQWNG